MSVTSTSPVSIERRADGVAVVRIDNAGTKLNTISRAVVAGVKAAADELTADPPGAVVLTGRETLFSAGAQIEEFQTDSASELGHRYRTAYDAFDAIPRVTIAAINGYTLGAGCELILTCDFRVAGEGARIGQPEILLGLIPGAGGTQRLPRLVGRAKAKEMILGGRPIDAATAQSIGLVDRVVPDEQVLSEAIAWAGRFASGAVLAHAEAKQLIDRGPEGALAAGLDMEDAAWARLHATEDAQGGIQSFFDSGPGNAVFRGR
jgi:enoyl-CoA hydratase